MPTPRRCKFTRVALDRGNRGFSVQNSSASDGIGANGKIGISQDNYSIDTPPLRFLKPVLNPPIMPPMTTQNDPRPNWDDYFMDIAQVVAKRGNCSRRKVAAVIVNEHRIISTGYNGTPRGITNCCDGGCPRCSSDAPSGENLGECICAHAEENAIVQAAYHGIAVRDSILYCTLSPCLVCTKMIINAGIKEVVYEQEYHFSEQARNLFAQAGIVCRQLERNKP